MITFSLQSGSDGNAIYVEAGDTRLLFDAGISGRRAEQRMALHGRSIRDCDAVIISHHHRDHTAGAGVLQRRFGLPLFVSPRVRRAVGDGLGAVVDVRTYQPGDSMEVGDAVIHTIRTPHDGIDTVCFVVEHDGRRLGILTDLGRPFAGLRHILSDVDAAYLESNYDPDMLWAGGYPERLKHRIAGDGGHLSNEEAADLVDREGGPRLRWVAVAHLSEENNRPELALDAHHQCVGESFPVHLAPRHGVSDVFEV